MTTDDRAPSWATLSTCEPELASRPSPTHRPKTPRKRKHLPLWQETILLLGDRAGPRDRDQGALRAGLLHPVGVDGAGAGQATTGSWSQKVSYWFGGAPAARRRRGLQGPRRLAAPTEDVGPANPLTKVMAKIGLYPSGGHLVKRVIGVAGDTITCCDDQGRIMVNGVPLDEAAYIQRRRTSPATAR